MLNAYLKNLVGAIIWMIFFSSYALAQTSYNISIPNTNNAVVSSKASQKSGSKVKLGDYVWFDYNENGVQDFGEQGIYNVKVNLYNNSTCSDSPIRTTTTSDIGYYEFKDLSQSTAKHCIEVIYPSKWVKTLSSVGDDTFNSDITAGSNARGYIQNITLSNNLNLDAGLHHSDSNCKTPILTTDDIGRYDSTKGWSKRYMLNVEFKGLDASGFCHEYENGGPQTDDKYTVHLEDRLGFSDEQRDYLSRVFGFMSDQEVNALVVDTFDSNNKHVWFNIISASLVWYYSDWNRDSAKLEEFIDTKSYLSSLTLAEKESFKNITKLIINKTEGLNGETQYDSIVVYYLYNETNTNNQDIIVPITSIVPDTGTCVIPPKTVAIDIEVATNGSDADKVTGPSITFGETVTWTYVVKNTGDVPLTTVVVTDNKLNQVCTIANLDAGVSKSCTKSGKATEGQYANVGKVTGIYADQTVEDSDPSHYVGGVQPLPSIDIEVATDGSDADEATGPEIDFDEVVTWTYVVKNTGNVVLTDVIVTDNRLKEICTVDSLDVGLRKTCTKSGKALEGQYANVGTATGKYLNTNVQDSDPSHYLGGDKPAPAVEIEVSTNGSDADKASGPSIGFDEEVTWTYVVKNIGNVSLTNVTVTDNKLNDVCSVMSLAINESKVCTKTGKAIEGQYANIGTVKAKSAVGTEVTAQDPSHYMGDTKVITAPIVQDDTKSGVTGQAVTLETLSNDKGIDAELNPESVVLIDINVEDDGKKLLVKGQGVWTVNDTNGKITFTPEAGYTDDPIPVRYTVEDLNGNVSNEGIESIDYPQTSPKAEDETKIGERCKPVTIEILKNDTDPEDDINSSSVELLLLTDWVGTDTDNDGDIDNVVVLDEGTWSVDANGLLTYTPSNDCSANPTRLRYRVSDKTNNVSNKAIVIVTYPEPEKASVGNFVWFDADKNGEQNEGESGLSGITVELYDANSELNGTTVTDENGSYLFADLDAGAYTLKFTVKEGYSLTEYKKDGIEESLNSDADMLTGKTTEVILTEGENNDSIDAGMFITAKPSITVTKSTNDGKVANILVGDPITWTYILTNTGNTLLSDIVVTDDKEGNITNCVGDGSLQALVPTKSITCTQTGVAILGAYQNSVVVTAKDTDGKTVKAEDSSSYVGQETPVELGTVGDYIWLDLNRDGIQDDNELPLKDIQVELFDKDRKSVGTTKSDDAGKYLFEDVLAGEYYVKFTIPSGYSTTVQTADEDKTKDSNANLNGTTATFTLEAGENDLSIDLGLHPKLTNLGDRVFLDENANGIQDEDEKTGVANVVVKLYREDNTLIEETKTTSTGLYLFRNIVPANYYVLFDVPNNYKVSPQAQGANKSTDSDTDTSGKTEIITLIGGQDNKSIDMGLYQDAIKLGDRVFYDTNKNGIQDDGETGVGDVLVRLYNSDTNELVDTTRTSASGIYLFDNIVAGEYYVLFTKPSGYSITKAGKGSKDEDSNPDASGRTENITLVSGMQDSSIDMGVYQDMVSYGDRVFLDSNHNGLQDLGEKGVRDINVTIISANSDFSKSMLTDENGNYLFLNLPAGEYSAEFRDIPYGHLITEQDVNNNANDLNDSDAFLEDEKIITEVTLLTPGKNDLSWDLGIFKTVCLPGKAVIGNLVFEDFNKNGIQDIGEHGVENVAVALFNNDTDEKVESTTTDENGLYEFTHVDPMYNYYIQFTVPSGFVVSPQDQDDEIIDSDADETGKTDVIVVEADKIDSTIDMGIYREGSMIGDKVFFDDLNDVSNGIQDEGELGAHDIKVTLFDVDGIEVNSTRTNVSGEYHFTNVPKGRYTIQFSEIPQAYVFSTINQGNDDEKDSDANTNGRTNVINIDGKTNITSIDAGLKKVNTGMSSSDIKSGVTGQNVTLDVLGNDLEGTFNFDATTVKISFVPEGAILSDDGRTLTVPTEGVWSVDPDTGAITFTPNDGFTGDPTAIAYTVQDTEGNETGADVEVNYPPLAVDDNVNAQVGAQVIVYVLENDSETSSPLDVTSVRLIDPTNGNEVETVVVDMEGVWNVNIDGSISFTPDDGFASNPTVIEYIVSELAGDVSNRATISILYPDAVDDVIIVSKDNVGEIVVTAPDNDSNNTIANTITIGCEGIGVDTLVVNGEGTWRVTENGSIGFTPEDGFIGEPTDIQYTIALVSGERSNCAIVDIKRELLAMDDNSVINVGAVTLVNILTNDFGSLNAQSVQLVLPLNPNPGLILSNDAQTLTVPDEGVWSVNDLGIVSFTAIDGFVIPPTPIRYTVENNSGLLSNIANITLTVGAIAIVANDDNALANGGNPVIINVLTNDNGDLNSSSVRIIDSDNEEVKELVVPSEGTWTVGDNGNITFTGEVGFVGTPTPIKYIVNNNSPTSTVLSDVANVSITGTCDCRPYETSIPAMGQLAIASILILTLLISMFFFKEEYYLVK